MLHGTGIMEFQQRDLIYIGAQLASILGSGTVQDVLDDLENSLMDLIGLVERDYGRCVRFNIEKGTDLKIVIKELDKVLDYINNY